MHFQKNEGGREGGSNSASVWHVAIEGYLQFERVIFVLEIYFRFRLL